MRIKSKNVVLRDWIPEDIHTYVEWQIPGHKWQSKETNWLSAGISLNDPACWGRGLGYGILREEWKARELLE